MISGTRKCRPAGLRGYAGRKLAPMIEAVEPRTLLDGGAGAIAGTVYSDGNGNGLFDGSDGYLSGVTVELFRAGAAAPLATAVTDASGGYAFKGLAAGAYDVVESSPTSAAVVGTRARSDLYQTSEPDAKTLRVNLTDPAGVFVNYNGVQEGQFLSLNTEVNGTPIPDAVGFLKVSLGTSAGATDLNAGYLALCLNETQRLSFAGGEQFPVTPQAITDVKPGAATVPADRAGRVAYLFNHFGDSSLSNVQAAGLQLAIWELVFDTDPAADFGAGNFKVTGPVDPADQALLDQSLVEATNDFNASDGKSESAVFLHATGTNGVQSIIARGSFDFLNRATPAPASVSGFVYVDADNDGVKAGGDAAIPGVSVTLTGTDDLNRPVSARATTDANGFYQFTDLRPGNYTVTETQPAAFLDGKDTQGTPGGGTVGNDVFSAIPLAAGVNGQNNNFGEILPAGLSGYVYNDSNNNGNKDANEAGIPGTPVRLTGVDNDNTPVDITTTTNAVGFYDFSNLRPGVYTARETQPVGYADGKDTQGTPGTGKTGNDIFDVVSLSPGVIGVNNNFGERVPSSSDSTGDTTITPTTTDGSTPTPTPNAVVKVTLNGIHHQDTTVGITLARGVDPVQATNPANYTIIALGKDETYGTRDDSLVKIVAAKYDSATNTVALSPNRHLNLHYHYLLKVSIPGGPNGRAAVNSTRVFGRSAVPVFNYHGVIKPAPKMTPREVRHNQAVVKATLDRVARDGGVVGPRHARLLSPLSHASRALAKAFSARMPVSPARSKNV